LVPGKQPEAKPVKVSGDNIYYSKGSPNTYQTIPDPIQGIKRLSSIKVLGVIISLTTSDHVIELIATC